MSEIIHEVPFYFSTIRRLIATFGTVFNNIMIQRVDEKDTIQNRFRVPVGYGSKQHWFYRLKDGVVPQEGDVRVAVVLPRISFMLTGMSYSPGRALNRFQQNAQKPPYFRASDGAAVRQVQYAPVPYDFKFSVTVYAKNQDDGLQIIEQFAPYFNPTVNLRVKEIKELNLWNDVTIEMGGDITANDEFATGFTEHRTLSWDLDFTLRSNLYLPVEERKIILSTIVNIENFDTLEPLEVITTTANAGELTNKDNSTTTITIN